MEPIEIIILAAGIILVAATYIMSEKFELGGKEVDEELSNNTKKIAMELARNAVEQELAEAIDDKVEAALVEMDKMANEKIMAVGNYSDEILDRINKNHNEVMFLYNMLNEKEATLKNTVRDIEALKLSVKKMALVSNISSSAVKRTVRQESQTVAAAKAPARLEEKPVASPVSAPAPAPAPVPAASPAAVSEPVFVPEQAPAPKSVESENSTLRNRKMSQREGNKNEEIFRLHSEGISNMEIAKKLGIGIGEVRLVIDLFRKDG